MKKSISIAIILITLFQIFAVNSVYIGTGNDLFSLGITNNDDDQLSFNLFTDIETEKNTIAINLDSYTKRYNARLDILSVIFSHPHALENFTITPSAGVTLAGNLCFQTVQNLLHEKMNIPTVIIDYDFPLKAFSNVNLEVNYSQSLPHNLSFELQAESFNTIGLSYSQTASAMIKYKNTLGAGLGYRYYKADADSPTLVSYERFNNGPVSNFFVDTGFFRFEHFSALKYGCGFGSLSFNVKALFEESSYKEETISTEVGKTYLLNAGAMPSLKQFSVSAKIKDNLFVYLNDNYESGCTMIVEEDFDDTARRTARNQRKFVFLTAGIEKRFYLTDYIQPSVRAGLGTLYTREWKLNYLQEDYPMRNAEVSAFAPIADAGINLYILPDNLLKVAKSNIRLNLFAGSYIVANSTSVNTVLSSDGSNIHASLFMPYLGFSAHFGF